jgi:hypothetical protein
MRRSIVLAGIVVALGLMAEPRGQAGDATATATLTSTACPGSGCVSLARLSGAGSGTVQLSGTFSGALVLEATANGSTYVPMAALEPTTGAAVATLTGPGLWLIGTAGYQAVRVRAVTLTSGSVLVTIRVSTGTQAVVTRSPVTAQVTDLTCTTAGSAVPCKRADTAYGGGSDYLWGIGAPRDRDLASRLWATAADSHWNALRTDVLARLYTNPTPVDASTTVAATVEVTASAGLDLLNVWTTSATTTAVLLRVTVSVAEAPSLPATVVPLELVMTDGVGSGCTTLARAVLHQQADFSSQTTVTSQCSTDPGSPESVVGCALAEAQGQVVCWDYTASAGWPISAALANRGWSLRARGASSVPLLVSMIWAESSS